MQLWFCVKLASKRFAQLWFFLKCAPFVNNRRKTLKLCKAVLDKTCNKQRAQPRCCSKLAPSHTTQLSFCFKLARIVTKVKLEKNTVRIFPVTQNWRQNTLQNCRFTENWRLLLNNLTKCSHSLNYSLCERGRKTENLPKLV